MQWSVVDYRQVQNSTDFRLDAARFADLTLRTHRTIAAQSHRRFNDHITVFESGKNLHQTRKGALRYVRTQNIRQVFLDASDISFTNLSMNLTDEGDLLFVRVGEGVGNNCVINDAFSGYCFSDNVIRLKVIGINPYYCSVFFNSMIGNTYFKSFIKGTARSLLSRSNFRDILIPFPSVKLQSAIEGLIKRSYQHRSRSSDYYKSAETLLLTELGLQDWQPKKQLSFVVNYAEVEDANRFDADYFQPHYKELEEAIINYHGGYSSIGIEFDQNLTQLKARPKEKYNYVEIGSIDVTSGDIHPTQLDGSKLPANAKRILRQGEIIVSKVRTYRGGISIVPEDGLIGSGAFTVLSEKSRIKKEVLFAFLKSKPLLEWSLKPNRGTSYPVIHDSDVLDLNIPLFKDDIQYEICSLITQSRQERDASKRLVETAKRAVEIAIEEDESAAFRFIEMEAK